MIGFQHINIRKNDNENYLGVEPGKGVRELYPALTPGSCADHNLISCSYVFTAIICRLVNTPGAVTALSVLPGMGCTGVISAGSNHQTRLDSPRAHHDSYNAHTHIPDLPL